MLKYKTKYFDFDSGAVAELKKSVANDEIPSTYEIKARFTDSTPDSHGDIITREGTTRALPDYREWRNIRYMHQPKAVGLAKHIGEEDGADLEWNEVVVKLVDKDTIHQVQEGVLKGLSVGILFNPFDTASCEWLDDGGWKIKEYMLAEISVVDHPAHPNASVIEAALGEVEGDIKSFSKELKNVLRSATSTEELVPLLKSLTVEQKEIDMLKEAVQIEEEKEILEEGAETEVLEKEGRDWDKEQAMPDEGIVPEEDEEEEDEEEAEAESEEEAVEVEADPEPEEAVEELEAEVEADLEVEVEADVELDIVEEVDEEELLELPEEELHIEDSEEEEEEEEEMLPESNEEAELSIKVNEEEDVIDRLARLEAMLEKLLGESTEGVEAATAEADVETLAVTEQEEKDLAETELTTPSNRKANMDIGISEDEEEVVGEKTITYRKKYSDSETRIRKVLENLEL